jgi:hypothetical protein
VATDNGCGQQSVDGRGLADNHLAHLCMDLVA